MSPIRRGPEHVAGLHWPSGTPPAFEAGPRVEEGRRLGFNGINSGQDFGWQRPRPPLFGLCSRLTSGGGALR